MKIFAQILGTGSHNTHSDTIVSNDDLHSNVFYDATGKKNEKPSPEIVQKFEEITGTKQRHYAAEGKITSDLAIEAGGNAIISSGIDPEEIDCIIVANNFGDVASKKDKIDLVPSFAARIKNHLQIINPNVIAYDIAVGGPDAAHEFRVIADYLGLKSSDLVVHVNDHDQEDICEIAEYLLPKCSVEKEALSSIVVVHYLGHKPSLATKVKNGLGITNPNTIAYDIFFGCPGFLQGTIHANRMIQNAKIKKALIIGAEILSRVAEKEDVDSMLYADGGGAIVLGAVESETPEGILFTKVRSDTFNQQAFMIQMGKAYNPNHDDPNELFLKMQGRRVHKYALSLIPSMIKETLEEAGISITDVKKMVFHQPNPLMLKEIALRTFAQFDMQVPEDIVTIIGDTYGNPSVASIPLILDLIYKDELKNHKIQSGDIAVMLSIGAGMNINIVIYKRP